MRVAYEVDYAAAGIRGATHTARQLFERLPRLAPKDDFLLFGWWLRDRERKAEQFAAAASERVRLSIQPWPQSAVKWLEWGLGLPMIEDRLDKLAVDVYDCARAPVTGFHGRLVVRGIDCTQVSHPEWHVPASLRAWETIYLPALKKADKVVCYTRYQADDMIKLAGVDPRKIVLTYPGVDHSLFKPEADAAAARAKFKLPARYLLMVGPFDDVQNFPAVLGALRLWSESGPELPPIVCAGPIEGYVLDLQRQAREAGFEKSFQWVGYVPHNELAGLMRGAEALVYPSTLPGVEMPPMETLATGTPVITSLDEVIEGEAGLLIDGRSPKSLYEAMRKAWETPSLRETLGRKGIERSRVFSWDALAEKTLAVYRELAGKA